MRGVLTPVVAAALFLGGSGTRVHGQDVPAGGEPLEDLDRAGRALVDRCSPAVVRIEAERGLRVRVLADSEEERRTLEETLRRTPPSESVSATGFLLDESGLVLTTSAVAGGATSLRVLFTGGVERKGEVLGEDGLAGVALVRIPPVEGIRALRFSARESRPGTLTLLLAPEGAESPGLHFGFVKHARRAFGLYDAWLVSSVPFEVGQAGAPLLDAQGDVLGMAVAPRISVTYRTIDQSRTVEKSPGFSTFVPAGELKRIAADLRAIGRVRRALLGVKMIRGEPVVREVPADFPASRAGVAPGDRVLAVDGIPLSTAEEVTGFIQRRAPGTAVTIRLRAPGGPERDLEVTLGELPQPVVPRGLFNGLGIAERESYDLSAAKFQVEAVEGGRYLVVETVAGGSAAERAGILPGDWIVEIRRKPVLSEREFADAATAIAAAADEESIEVLVYTAGDAQRRLVVLK